MYCQEQCNRLQILLYIITDKDKKKHLWELNHIIARYDILVL